MFLEAGLGAGCDTGVKAAIGAFEQVKKPRHGVDVGIGIGIGHSGRDAAHYRRRRFVMGEPSGAIFGCLEYRATPFHAINTIPHALLPASTRFHPLPREFQTCARISALRRAGPTPPQPSILAEVTC